ETEDGAHHLPMCRSAINPAEIPARRVHGHQQLGAAAAEQLVPELRAVAVLEGETGQEDPVEEALEQCRQPAPPDRIDEHQMLGPVNQPLGLEQVRFQALALSVTVAQYRVELHFAQFYLAHHMPLAAGALAVSLGQGMAEAVLLRGAENQQDPLAIAFQRRGAALAFNHAARLRACPVVAPIGRTPLQSDNRVAALPGATYCLRCRP